MAQLVVQTGQTSPKSIGSLISGNTLMQTGTCTYVIGCDMTACFNPAHLFLGTQKDNIVDMVKKGRHVPGDGPIFGHKNPKCVLSPDEIRQIRATHAGYGAYTRLAERFGVCRRTISNVVLGKTYRDVV